LHLPCDPHDFPFLHFDRVFIVFIIGVEIELNAESDAGWLIDCSSDGDLATGDRIGVLDGFNGITIVCIGWT